jgi:hypothetical protein
VNRNVFNNAGTIMNFRLEVFAAIKIRTVGIRIKKQCIVLGGCYMMALALTLQKLHFAKECFLCGVLFFHCLNQCFATNIDAGSAENCGIYIKILKHSKKNFKSFEI